MPCGVTCSHLTHKLVQAQKPAAESAGKGVVRLEAADRGDRSSDGSQMKRR